MTFEWSASLVVGVREIDEQHQELFRRAERLILALRAGDRSEVEPLIRYLTDYAVSHFEAEERCMAQTGYPGLPDHRAAHQQFRDEFQGLVRDYQRKGPTPLVALSIHNWLSDWLRTHIGGADVDLGMWLKARDLSLSG
jgi:hemerythrin